MSHLNEDGNILGRVGAVALLIAAGFGLHRLNCSAGMCPVMKTDSCCSAPAESAPATPPAAPAPAK